MIKTLISGLNVAPQYTRVALVSFDNGVNILQSLANFTSLDATNSLLDSIRYTTIDRLDLIEK